MKKVLYILLGIVALLLIIALVAPKDYTVERSVTINKPKTEVFNYLKLLKNQDNWSVWAKIDPAMKKTYSGTDGTVGFISAWEGNDDVGKGEQEIKKITEGERIDFELRFIKPFEATSPVFMTTQSISDNQTKVTWSMSGNMPYPMNLMLLFMNMEKQIGGDFETGLNNLKGILEK
ncbi:Polyketide cyclase / dehydrase and lipid transport [Pseudarcicella hirudinis]|uniref:Polyketide cyclase / dehydrase and lipid transport n=2 Tax=Pseudarcicella hirudinis TaxID=1079859 RepID=A0A1I5YIT3_9BACT|nr:SRPBCC family protein [Pseudarcicella hirudinis]SFQ44133.1 Polyketide cyclase / dehydrase and lipid transport [Pseudarcicella hirudinis]